MGAINLSLVQDFKWRDKSKKIQESEHKEAQFQGVSANIGTLLFKRNLIPTSSTFIALIQTFQFFSRSLIPGCSTHLIFLCKQGLRILSRSRDYLIAPGLQPQLPTDRSLSETLWQTFEDWLVPELQVETCQVVLLQTEVWFLRSDHSWNLVEARKACIINEMCC